MTCPGYGCQYPTARDPELHLVENELRSSAHLSLLPTCGHSVLLVSCSCAVVSRVDRAVAL